MNTSTMLLTKTSTYFVFLHFFIHNQRYSNIIFLLLTHLCPFSQRLLLLTVAVVSAVSADVSHLIDASVDGYHYEPPKVKLCPDGTAREVCPPPPTPAPRCPPGKLGIWPNCDNEYLPPQKCPTGTSGTFPNCKKPECPPGKQAQLSQYLPPLSSKTHTWMHIKLSARIWSFLSKCIA